MVTEPGDSGTKTSTIPIDTLWGNDEAGPPEPPYITDLTEKQILSETDALKETL